LTPYRSHLDSEDLSSAIIYFQDPFNSLLLPSPLQKDGKASISIEEILMANSMTLTILFYLF
jgi:hypothetical protein